ncbi:ankyrin repeat-containing protein C6C3.08-like [Pistacia vera]|uniref:ankyrin repeat-containing protein C6C3.08-like n=1 Tax=Pistacia vera TaxID=55513 RepID=UPI001263DA00|nr:ankyrin repeat-containing protein C6C3.08-like [Pistacia vera]
MEQRVTNNGFNQSSELLEHVQPHKEMKFSGKDESSSWSHDPPEREMNPINEEIKDHVRYRKLYKALQENDWKSVDDFIRLNSDALTANIRVHWQETIFHIITRKLGTPFWLIKKLVSKVPPKQLEQLTDRYGGTALFCAASFGNKKAAEAFVDRNKDLPNFPNIYGLLPIHRAAACGHKEMIQYLLKVTTAPLNDDKGVTLLKSLISSGLYGSAFDLLKKYPDLISKTEDRGSILEALANKPLAFESGSGFGFWRRLIYHWIPLQEEHIHYPENVHGDEENQIESSKK